MGDMCCLSFFSFSRNIYFGLLEQASLQLPLSVLCERRSFVTGDICTLRRISHLEGLYEPSNRECIRRVFVRKEKKRMRFSFLSNALRQFRHQPRSFYVRELRQPGYSSKVKNLAVKPHCRDDHWHEISLLLSLVPECEGCPELVMWPHYCSLNPFLILFLPGEWCHHQLIIPGKSIVMHSHDKMLLNVFY